MKSVAVFLLLIATVFAVDWASYTCAQMGTFTTSSFTCAEWNTFPSASMSCLTTSVVCNLGSLCGVYFNPAEALAYAQSCQAHSNTPLSSSTSTGGLNRP